MALFRPYERTEKSKSADAADLSAKLVPSSKNAAAAESTKSSAEKSKSADTPSKATKASVKAPAKVQPAAATSAVSDDAGTSSEAAAAPVKRGYTPKKTAPTPTRAEAEAARQERLNPTLSTKDRKKQVREANRLARVEAFAKQEDEPTRVLLRDYIDTRWTATEFLIPVMLVLLAANIAFMQNFFMTQIISVLVFIVFLIWLTNVTIVWRNFKKFARTRIKDPKFNGLLMYGNSRMMTIRRFRRPGPRIERGAKI